LTSIHWLSIGFRPGAISAAGPDGPVARTLSKPEVTLIPALQGRHGGSIPANHFQRGLARLIIPQPGGAQAPFSAGQASHGINVLRHDIAGIGFVAIASASRP